MRDTEPESVNSRPEMNGLDAGFLKELHETADEPGGLPVDEIAEIFAESELHLEYDPSSWDLGNRE